MIDTGLDETSCYFVDDDGEEIEHGYFFDEIGFSYNEFNEVTGIYTIFTGGNFTFFPNRRKVSIGYFSFSDINV